jgi:hypothetical protein
VREIAPSDAGRQLLVPGGSRRLHRVEAAWLARIRDRGLFAYEFDPEPFKRELPEAGYWTATQDIVPLSVTTIDDLLGRHIEAEIELRIVKTLWPLIDAITTSGLEFSIIRKANAQPRHSS